MRVLRDVPGGRIENHDRKRITKHSNEPDRAARRARAPRPGPLCELCVRPLCSESATRSYDACGFAAPPGPQGQGPWPCAPEMLT